MGEKRVFTPLIIRGAAILLVLTIGAIVLLALLPGLISIDISAGPYAQSCATPYIAIENTSLFPMRLRERNFTGPRIAGWTRQEAKVERKMLLLDLLRQARETEMDFVDTLSDQQRARTGTLEDWSAKDTISHVAAWKSRMADNLLAVSEERPPTGTRDLDRQNALFFEAYRDQTWEEVLSVAAGAFQRILAQVETLAERELVSREKFPWQDERPLWRLIVGTGYIHPIAHLAEFHRNQGHRERAAEMVGEMARSMAGLDDGPAWQGAVKYNMACHYSLLGATAEAIRELQDALTLNPTLIDWSKQDPDLEAIRGEPAYQAIYEPCE